MPLEKFRSPVPFCRIARAGASLNSTSSSQALEEFSGWQTKCWRQGLGPPLSKNSSGISSKTARSCCVCRKATASAGLLCLHYCFLFCCCCCILLAIAAAVTAAVACSALVRASAGQPIPNGACCLAGLFCSSFTRSQLQHAYCTSDYLQELICCAAGGQLLLVINSLRAGQHYPQQQQQQLSLHICRARVELLQI
jgi:hypothetical protein